MKKRNRLPESPAAASRTLAAGPPAARAEGSAPLLSRAITFSRTGTLSGCHILCGPVPTPIFDNPSGRKGWVRKLVWHSRPRLCRSRSCGKALLPVPVRAPEARNNVSPGRKPGVSVRRRHTAWHPGRKAGANCHNPSHPSCNRGHRHLARSCQNVPVFFRARSRSGNHIPPGADLLQPLEIEGGSYAVLQLEKRPIQ